MLLYGLIFAIIGAGFSIILKSGWWFFLQLAVILGLHVSEGIHALFIVLFFCQLGILVFLLYRYLIEVEYNFLLVMEKTHQHPRLYTEGGKTGRKRHFL